MKRIILTFLLIFTTFVTSYAGMKTEAWLWRYSYIEDIRTLSKNFPPFPPTNEYFLVILVDARHADYSSTRGYVTSLAESLIRQHYLDPGHAWIVLAGKKDGKPWVFEGGHSVNCPAVTKYYFQHVLGLFSEEEDPNPARHLFAPTNIGSLEQGPGDSQPTFAAAIPLTQEGFERILKLFDEDGYDFSCWGIQGPNCIQFALSCLATAGIEFECHETLPVPPSFSIFGNEIRLWSDPEYSRLNLRTPDLLEKRLFDLVRQGTAYFALPWYEAFSEMRDEGYITNSELPAHPVQATKKGV
jgi:hypothetical protein